MKIRARAAHLRPFTKTRFFFHSHYPFLFWCLALLCWVGVFCVDPMASWREATPLQLNLMVKEEPYDEYKEQLTSSSFAAMVSSPSAPPPPPIMSMSLRTRQSSAMALERIFEHMQRNQTGSDPLSTECQEYHEASEATRRRGFQALRHQSMPDLRSAAPLEQDLGLTLHKPLPQHPAVSSPPSLLQQPPAFLQNPRFLQKTVRPPSPVKPASAQLTVFYSGTVNVYNDVPADKAQAIMLLAGTGNPCSANCQCRVSSVETLNTSNEVTASHGTACVSTLAMSVSQGTLYSKPATGAIIKPLVAAPILVRHVIPSIPSSPSVAAASDLSKPQLPLKRPHSGIELPYARKASLARFLEKRKDRVQMKQADQLTKEEADNTAAENPSSQ